MRISKFKKASWFQDAFLTGMALNTSFKGP